MAGKVGDNQPIIVKKIKKGGHGHHGGAWKVAYADFVTAMMAFFLLLWLLNATTEDQRKGIADYFSPASIARSTSGAGGLFGGKTLVENGNRPSSQGVHAIVAHIAPPPTGDHPELDRERDPERPSAESGNQSDRKPDDRQLAERLAEKEQEAFEKAEQALRQAIQANPALKELARHLVIDNTPEGLRIQLVDQEQSSMFSIGSSVLNERARALLGQVAGIVRTLPNRLSISGHTDATPFRFGNSYGNWELSADRANAARRALLDAGIEAPRIRIVTGQADQEPLIAADPAHPSNRRISIVLLREQPLVASR